MKAPIAIGQTEGRAVKVMKIYNSFLIRCWLLQSTAEANRSVFEIEHIQTGERRRVASFAEIQRLVLAAHAPESKPASPASSGAQKNESDE